MPVEFTRLSDEERTTLTKVLIEQNGGVFRRSSAWQAFLGVAAPGDLPVMLDRTARFGTPCRHMFAAESYLRSDHRLLPQDIRCSPAPIHPELYAPAGANLPADFLLRLCREIESSGGVKEETVPSTFKLAAIGKATRRDL
jgi:hypothetical protein